MLQNSLLQEEETSCCWVVLFLKDHSDSKFILYTQNALFKTTDLEFKIPKVQGVQNTTHKVV